jgi:hypothetical protein
MDNQNVIVRVFAAAADKLSGMGYESEVDECYSGRGMYGKSCVGIITDASGATVGAAVQLAATEQDVPDPMSLVPRRSDSMGRKTIYY